MSKRIVISVRDFPLHRQNKVVFYRDNFFHKGKEYKNPTKSSRIRLYRMLDDLFISNGDVKVFPLREFEYQILRNSGRFTISGIDNSSDECKNLKVEKIGEDAYQFTIGDCHMIETSDVEINHEQVKKFRDALTHLIGDGHGTD